MKAKNSKQAMILRLIVDDLLNYKLVSGLQKLNLASPRYFARFDVIIFQLLGFDGVTSNQHFQYYKKRRTDAERICIEKNNEDLTDLAFDILCELERRKKHAL